MDQLPSGAYRVRVYAGSDPVTGKRHDLTEIVPPGRRAAAEAERVRTRLLGQLDERRNPRTKATLDQLLDRYVEVLDIDESTRKTYIGYIENRIRPTLGELQVGRLDGEVLDSFYAELRRCRHGCTGRRRGVDHRTRREHDCDERCRPHLAARSPHLRSARSTGSSAGALERAVRWRWIAVSPADWAEPPPPPRPNPQPPSAQEAARLLTEAWKDSAWGAFLWLAMTVGARRGELCALRCRHVDLAAAVLTIEVSVGGRRSATRQKDTKTHQMRRVALDMETVEILREHIARQDDLIRQLGLKPPRDAFLFSLDPDCSTPLLPDSVSQRYDRLARRLDIDASLHKLRHYNATELIGAGVDVRTVAGRLGHGGGGSTTLRVYAAWVTEADRRAADTVASRLPRRQPPEREFNADDCLSRPVNRPTRPYWAYATVYKGCCIGRRGYPHARSSQEPLDERGTGLGELTQSPWHLSADGLVLERWCCALEHQRGAAGRTACGTARSSSPAAAPHRRQSSAPSAWSSGPARCCSSSSSPLRPRCSAPSRCSPCCSPSCCGAAFWPLTLFLVSATVSVALDRAGAAPAALDAVRQVWRRAGDLASSFLPAAVLIGVLSVSAIGLPVAAWLAVRLQFVRSGALVRHRGGTHRGRRGAGLGRRMPSPCWSGCCYW